MGRRFSIINRSGFVTDYQILRFNHELKLEYLSLACFYDLSVSRNPLKKSKIVKFVIFTALIILL